MMVKVVNSDFRYINLNKTADLLVIDPPHDMFFKEMKDCVDRDCKEECVKFIIDSDLNSIAYANMFGNRFSFFMVHDFIFHIGGGNRPFHQFDLITVIDFDKSRFNNLHDGFSNLIRIKSERMIGTKNLKHPHQKPVPLYDTIIKHFSKKGDTVLDYFVGSGTIIKACVENERSFFGCDIDKKNCENAMDFRFDKRKINTQSAIQWYD